MRYTTSIMNRITQASNKQLLFLKRILEPQITLVSNKLVAVLISFLNSFMVGNYNAYLSILSIFIRFVQVRCKNCLIY